MSFGSNLVRLRKKRNWTQEELSRHTDVPAISIARYEIGRSSPTMESLAKLAKGLGCSTDELVFDEGDGVAQARFTDSELLRQFEEVHHMNDIDREAIKRIVEAMIVRGKLSEILPESPAPLPKGGTPPPARKDLTQLLDRLVQASRNPDRRGPRESSGRQKI